MINSNFVLKLKLLVNDPSTCNIFHTYHVKFNIFQKKKPPKVTISHLLIKEFFSVKINCTIRRIIFLKQLFDQFNRTRIEDVERILIKDYSFEFYNPKY